MIAVRLENIGKSFFLTHQKESAKGFLHAFPGHKTATEFWALRSINLEIEKGKVIGIIGRNGAGKTTLLNILAGVSPPTIGNIQINGQASSLLTLGAGFQDELTGKENIYLNSSIIGMSRNEINKKYRSIVEFSELGDFLDFPLQTYSQGMRLRLGFSVAIHMNFDIFLIDEILSVGDVSFQKKSFDKIEEFRKQQKTMIITTQSLDIIERFCEEVYLLENGEVVEKGCPQKVNASYLKLLKEKKLPEAFQRRSGRLRWWADRRFWDKKEGSREARIEQVRTYNSHHNETDQFRSGERVTIRADFVVQKELSEPHFGVAIFREDGVYCYGPNTVFDDHKIYRIERGKGFFTIEYKSLCLRPGRYRFSTAIWDKNELWAYDYHVAYYRFEVIGENIDGQLLDLRHDWMPKHWWNKFNIFRAKKEVPFYNLDTSAQDETLSNKIGIEPVELLDSSDHPGTVFRTGEALKVRLRFKFNGKPQDYYAWFGLFRNDDIYCHGASKKIKEEAVTLFYPNLTLLSGDYYLSLGVWKKGNKKPLFYRRRACLFKMSFPGRDHGTVYLDHSWHWQLP